LLRGTVLAQMQPHADAEKNQGDAGCQALRNSVQERSRELHPRQQDEGGRQRGNHQTICREAHSSTLMKHQE